MAHVHCVIVGFYLSKRKRQVTHRIFKDDGTIINAYNINGYLLNAENLFVWNRAKPICKIPEMGIGNKPIDDGNYLFDWQEMLDFIQKEPASEKYFHPYYGGEEFISGTPRYCLWLGDATPAEVAAMPLCMKRVEAVKTYRAKSDSKPTQELAKTPRRFHVENMPANNYFVVPRTSSQSRDYIPMGRLTPNDFCSDGIQLIPEAKLYHFGVLQSSIHMAWMRVVCGRLETRYRYSNGIVYNNFPWPNATEEQKATIEKTAQEILDVRNKYNDSSLEQLYNPSLMPNDLVDAHDKNNRSVAAIYAQYGINLNMTDEEIAIILMRVCTKLAAPKAKKRKKAKSRKIKNKAK
jgi:hypothetical protein